jgi:hypothetical protein
MKVNATTQGFEHHRIDISHKNIAQLKDLSIIE